MIKDRYKAVIFDLDGTLVDSMKDIASAVNRVLKDFGLPAQDTESFRSRVGWGLKRSLEMTLPPERMGDMDTGMELLLKYYRENPSAETEVYEGNFELIEDLKEREIALFVYTNKDQLTAEKIIGDIFPAATFDSVFGAVPGKALKPDAQAVKAVIAQTGYADREILYIGDSEVDMETAAAGNLDTLAVLWGYRQRDQLEKYEKLAYMESPDEIRRWIV
ncbi:MULTISPECIES: HAD family hydrolase [unclassified Oceanispirochaeta]|uniref:HAD family hydrolase n=1 Tax=unclassified Oceanispirochaeta TaxID=2635722 RepID=UPI000E09BE67|nr:MULTISPECIES: HAD family hydrolase [unclassified Oceanispirochaeta]MBF9017457.1 HAD family hydrolase [Oceanispirochaeta sp. M2]NPD74029.1 HAD family hydrolase [Oceanispirochaeta sp. M1]RDG30196.1 HAD family hydrolase [Oceanispirochaeta sp. M1]